MFEIIFKLHCDACNTEKEMNMTIYDGVKGKLPNAWLPDGWKEINYYHFCPDCKIKNNIIEVINKNNEEIKFTIE